MGSSSVRLILELIGGVGLFLLGMTLLTDGLKAFAGEALRQGLIRFTGTPLKAFISGVIATLLVQSSTATTITVIGFVSAGLMGFPQAIGVVMGASLGTTTTGWIVALLGLKVSVGLYALPMIGLGAFIRLLARGRWQAVGVAVAGFGLIFVGIDYLQESMEGLSSYVDYARLPSGGFLGNLIMVLLGAVMTVIMQSSGAAVATTLTALHTESIVFEQAAAIVIGAAIGTTLTGVLAAIGATVQAKRTALAHVSFNALSGLLALILLPLLLKLLFWAQATIGLEGGATSLAAFHTMFIALGVVIFLPSVRQFSRWIERMLPEDEPSFVRNLDPTVLSVPAVAIDASRRAMSEISAELFDLTQVRLAKQWDLRASQRLLATENATEAASDFLSRIPATSPSMPISVPRVAQMDALDHVKRLQGLLNRAPQPDAFSGAQLMRVQKLCEELLVLGASGLRGGAALNWITAMEEKAESISNLRREQRPQLLAETAAGGKDPSEALEGLDTMRWLDSVAYHAWRISNYLGDENTDEEATAESSDDLLSHQTGTIAD